MGAVRLSQLSSGTEQPLISLPPANLEHLSVLRIESSAPQRHLNDAPQPRCVQGDLLSSRIISARWKWPVYMFVP
jgi:hypothetical protein